MSNRYKGAVISATPPTTSGGPSGVASGAWTLEQQLQLQAASLWPSQPPPPFIEDVFSCFLYTGNATVRSITNDIDLATKGGLVWIKNRTFAGAEHQLFDTARGATKRIKSDTTDAEVTTAGTLTSFDTTGFSLGTQSSVNFNTYPQVSWTFRKQAKFFDIVTYTGTGSVRTVAHNLGSVPGCIIVKTLSTPGNDWGVYHRSLGATYKLNLNTDAASALSTGYWNNTEPTSSVFTVATSGITNQSGETYVAYLFAHDAGGFGLTETDNVISCGSYTGTGSNPNSITLGYEPQWILLKKSSDTANWYIFDNMRGMPVGSADAYLFPNSSDAESSTNAISPTATGFDVVATTGAFNQSGQSYIYVAIRRGPMAVPTVGTSVFAPVTYTGDNSNTRVITTGFPPDMVWTGAPVDGGRRVGDRLRGLFTNPGPVNYTYATGDETLNSYSLPQMSGWQTGNGTIRYENSTAANYVLHAFKRAPSFFDVVCYTGTGVAGRTVTHNLTVAPELIIVRPRSLSSEQWPVYASPITVLKVLQLNTTIAATTYSDYWNNTAPTSSVFSVGDTSTVNQSAATYVAYLFATCAGVSKVGSYTGNAGYTVTVPCGFTAGVRFVLIKRTDSTGDWYLWDSARGIVAGNDPYLLLNSTAAEVTGTDYVDTYAAGFEVTSTAPAGLNASAGTYIFLAIA